MTTWVYDGTSFTPVAKLTDEDTYSIVQDYLGTPIQAFDSKGKVVWDCVLDIYGKVYKLHGDTGFIPFRYQGQYLDIETGLAYNRFRYYSPELGSYISQDPIRLDADLMNLYAYVFDPNTWIDPLGLRSFTTAVGDIGEKFYRKHLRSQGFKLIKSQYGSNNGIDIIVRDLKTGKYHFFEIKSSTVGRF